MLSEKVSRSREEGRALGRRQPQARAAVTGRLEEVDALWENLQDKAGQRRERLGQAEAVHSYLTRWTELV